MGGGKDYPQTDEARQKWLSRLQEKTGTAKERLETLLDRYGTRAEAVAELMSGYVLLKDLPKYSRREIEFLAAQEQVIYLDDLILRRTLMGILGQGTVRCWTSWQELPRLCWAGRQKRHETKSRERRTSSKHAME